MRSELDFCEGWLFHLGELPAGNPAAKGPMYLQAKTERRRMGPAARDYDDYSENYAEEGLVTSNGGGEDSRRMAEELISRRMDGMVVTSCRELPAETTAHLAEVGIPTVLIERWAPGAMGDRIRIDDVAGARCAVAQRLAARRKRVAFIGCGDFSQEVERQRLWGYREALESAGVPEEIRLIRLTEDYTPEEGRRAMEALLESGGCDAVFCASDLLAAGVLQSLYRRNIRVPDQIAVTGYDNTVSAMLSPQISSVALDCDEIGRQAMALLLRRMDNPGLEEKEITILPTLIARD